MSRSLRILFIVLRESSESYMVNLLENPSLSPSRRSILTQAEWKVAAVRPSPASPSISVILCFNSFAALFVNVIASMLHGFTQSSATISARAALSDVFPSSKSRRNCISSSVTAAGQYSLLYALPK